MSLIDREYDFGSLYATHAPRVRRMLARRGIRNEDLDDALQEAFVTIHRLLPGFEGRSSIDTWLHAIVWRVAASFQRRTRHRSKVVSTWAASSIADQPASQPDPRIHRAMRQLEDEQRDIIALHDVGGLTISELSTITGRARATIRERLEHGRIALQRRMWTALKQTEDDTWPDYPEPPLAARLAQPNRVLVHDVIHTNVVIDTLDNIVIAVWRDDATDSAMESLIEVLFCALDKYPEGIRHLCIVPMSKPPSRETRMLVSWAAAKLSHRLVAAAWATEDAMMSLVAPIMNACFFVGGAPLNARFFGSPAPAAEWLAQHGAVEPKAILARVETMRGSSRANPPARD